MLRITFADLAEGDRVMAMGKVADDKKSVPTRAVIVMTKADIAKQDAERAEWRRRGILGVVSSSQSRYQRDHYFQSFNGWHAVGDNSHKHDKVELRRYPRLDQVWRRQEQHLCRTSSRSISCAPWEEKRAPDGTRFTPEKVVTGAFKTVAGTVTAVSAATGEIKITEG